jgi:hypothetical protein
MSGWIFVVAMLFIMLGISARVQRREDHQSDLTRLDEEIRLARFWGDNADYEEKSRADLVAEHKNWWSNIKFELGNWTAFLIGAAILLVAAVLWLGEDPSHTWGLIWSGIKDSAGFIFLLGLAAYLFYGLDKRLGNLEREISWLNRILKALKDHAEGMRKSSIENFLELKDRLDKLEGKST